MAQKANAARQVQALRDVAGGKVAVRTCIGCRKVGARNHLLRLAVAVTDSGDTEVVVDARRNMPGRGAWLHPNPECWQLAIKRRAVGRALPGVSHVANVEAYAANNLPQAPHPSAT